MRWTKSTLLMTLLPLLVAASVTRPATAMQDDDGDQEHRTRIHIQREGAAEGEEEGRHHVVFVGEDGEVQEIEGEGTEFSWNAGEHGRHYRMHGPGLSLRAGAFLGVEPTPLTPELRTHFGAPEGAGVMIGKVLEDSAAFSAGLRVGDIITSVEGESIESPRDLLHAIRSRDEGDAVTVEVYRDGKVQAFSAVLGKTEGRPVELRGMGPMRHFRGFPRGLELDCDDNGGDCEILLGRHLDLCGDDEECNVDISCKEGSCDCTVNGEKKDCEALHPAHHPHVDD